MLKIFLYYGSQEHPILYPLKTKILTFLSLNSFPLIESIELKSETKCQIFLIFVSFSLYLSSSQAVTIIFKEIINQYTLHCCISIPAPAITFHQQFTIWRYYDHVVVFVFFLLLFSLSYLEGHDLILLVSCYCCVSPSIIKCEFFVHNFLGVHFPLLVLLYTLKWI